MALLGVRVAGAGRVDEEVAAALAVSMGMLPVGMLRAEPLALDGEPGVALVAEDGELAAWLHVRVEADGRGCMDVSASTPALEAANRAFGGAAVRQLLANVAAGTCVAVGGALPVSAAPAAMAADALLG